MAFKHQSRRDFGEVLEAVEVFRAGTHTASNGTVITTTADELDRIAAAYDPAWHEAPVVIGHPAENGPAWGWVRALKRVGDRLVATLDLVPEFAETVRRGLFKKRSISLYNDLDGKGPYLRHVGFLGATPPAVKGLADISLADGAGSELTFEFDEKERSMSWKDKVKSLFTQAVDEIPEAGSPAPAANPTPAQVGVGTAIPRRRDFSEDLLEQMLEPNIEARVREAVAKARKDERDKATAEFAEASKKAAAEAARREHAGKLSARIDALVERGIVLPAWKKAGLSEFAAALPHGETATFEFGEAGATTRQTPADWFLSFLEKLPKTVHFGEVATRASDPGRGNGTAAARIGALIQEKMKANPSLGYAIAFSEVQQENPDLAAEYVADLRG